MTFIIEANWAQLDTGPELERATFALLKLYDNQINLTVAEDMTARIVRQNVYLPAYPLAEWLAWNWWRVLWEPQRTGVEWAMAHKLSTIGYGYVWPNVTISSDGQEVAISAKPTELNAAEPIRYISDGRIVLPREDFSRAAHVFIEQVIGKLHADGKFKTNLEAIWSDIQAEKIDPELARTRRFEALLGNDPDESNPDQIAQLVADSTECGEAAMQEVAAARADGAPLQSASALRSLAEAEGVEQRHNDIPILEGEQFLPLAGRGPAWKRGTLAADRLREQLGFGLEPMSSAQLAEVAATDVRSLKERESRAPFAFSIAGASTTSRIVFRSRWESGRRFDLARILADRLIANVSGNLHPATSTHTYRQKLQRAFAAEFLCPFDAIEREMNGDYSSERQEDVAEHFKVSPLVVQSQLANNKKIDRAELDAE